MEKALPSAGGGDLNDDPLVRRVIAAIAKTQGLPPEKISVDSTFEEMGFDSLDGVEILFSLEEEFDVDIPDEDAQEVTSVREAAKRLRPLVENDAPEVGATD